jgi:anti-sigma regulatory factor (Ser/Thr protein kinase)
LAQSPHVTVVVTPGRGVAMQYRPDLGAPSVQVAVRAGIAPEWVRLTQVEGLFRGYASEDGVTWHLIGEVILHWTGSPALAVTSHNNGVLTRAVFENVRLRRVLSR